MNSSPSCINSQSGNAMIYIILSLALLGGLTMVIARQNDQTGSQDLSYEKTEILTNKLIGYVGSAKNVVDQMEMSGTNIASLSFVRPNQASFEVAPHINKVFHPEGGGLNYINESTDIFPAATTPTSAWYITGDKNIQWTPTTANDVMVVAYGISQTLCQNINKKITNATTIPVITGTFKDILLSTLDGGGAGTLNTTSCAACNGRPSLCVASTGGFPVYAYYSIISAQ